jgi:FlaA1/EpsC-like NDP-sugar epimerase
MGAKIKILDLATRMLSLVGRKDIEIVFTGLRPGEKLTEEVVSSQERYEQTKFDKVRRIIGPGASSRDLISRINQFQRELGLRSEREISDFMKRIVEYA